MPLGLAASELQLGTSCSRVPFGLKAPQCAAQSRKAATCHGGKMHHNLTHIMGLDTIYLSGRHLLKTPFSSSLLLFPPLDHPQLCFGTDLRTMDPSPGIPMPVCFKGSVHYCQMWYAKVACCSGTWCPCPWDHSKEVLHSPSWSGSGAPQTDWSWCPFQRYSLFLPHTGSSRCYTLHAPAVCPRMSWRPPRLFPGTLKAQERSGVSTTGVLLWHKWPGYYCPDVVSLSAH